MTMKEADLFCKKHGKRLPTAAEWELAARGTDGRLYPWGNRFEKARANVIGLPDKGEEFRLKSIYVYPGGESPFGMLGGIGNAGQWFNSEGGYERSYIGGNYRFNPQDSLVYSTMPETGDPMPQLEVTTRCVSSSKTPGSN
jgi:formylglycine-generating enzyme required for sulfatase activity